MVKRRILYLPVETKARELLGKTFLAAKAVERGWIVILGRQKEVFRAEEQGPPGACFENSIPPYKAERLESSRRRGHRMVSLCEESIVYTDGLDYCNRRIGSTSQHHTDLFCVPGDWNAGHLREFRPESGTKIRVTGNPRFDTLMPGLRTVYQATAQQIRQRHGKFLLVNTNFGSTNPFERGRDVIADIARRGKVANEEHAALLSRWVSYKADHMECLQTVLAEISASGAFERVIIRPHPVENHDIWREWAGPYGMEVRYDGNANEWMLAAEAVLHTGCTTGLEGLLLDRPVASYIIDPKSEFLNCTDAVSVQVSSAGEFLAKVSEWRRYSPDDVRSQFASQRTIIRTRLENADPPMAADRILDALEELDLPEYTANAARTYWGVKWKSNEMLQTGRTMLRTLRDGKRRRAQKFPNLSLSDMTEPVQQWAAVGVLSRTPTFTELSNALWMVA